jgi:ABC-type nitrate/sulfonate/bicarbonate transport system substrate-binding protein
MDWNKQVVRRTMEGAGQYPGVQLQFLLMRLEDHPEAIPAIAAAIRDMGEWYLAHAADLEAEGIRRACGAQVLPINGEGV